MALDNRQVSYYAWRDLVYVSHPQNADYEKMNIFIPSAYLEGKSVNRLGQRPRGRLRSERIVCLDRFHLQIKKDRCLGSGFFYFLPGYCFNPSARMCMAFSRSFTFST